VIVRLVYVSFSPITGIFLKGFAKSIVGASMPGKFALMVKNSTFGS
jgi:hypothetical protein